MPVGTSWGQYRAERRFAVTICIFLLLLALEVTGERYISPNGSDDNNGLTQDTPWNTLDRACSDPGTLDFGKVILSAGEYSISSACDVYWDLEGDPEAPRASIKITHSASGFFRFLPGGSSAPNGPRTFKHFSSFSSSLADDQTLFFAENPILTIIEDVFVNLTQSGAILTVVQSQAELRNSTITTNVLSCIQSYPIVAYLSSLLVTDCNFGPIYFKGDGALFAQQANLTIRRSRFHDVSCNAYGAVTSAFSTNFVLEDSHFENNLLLASADLIITSVTNFHVHNTSFLNTRAHYGSLLASESSGRLSNCSFDSIYSNSSAVVSYLSQAVEIEGNIFKSTIPSPWQLSNNPALWIYASFNVSVFDNIFEDNQATYCSAMLVYDTPTKIYRNTFRRNWQFTEVPSFCVWLGSEPSEIYENNFYDPAYKGTLPITIPTAFAVAVWEGAAILHSNNYQLSQGSRALWISDKGIVTLQGDFGTDETSIQGMTTAAGHLVLDVSTVTSTGPFSFITSINDVNFTSTINTTRSHATIIAPNNPYFVTALQHAEFRNVDLDLRHIAYVCCTTGVIPSRERLTFRDSKLIIRDSVVYWYALRYPVDFIGPSSGLIISSDATLSSRSIYSNEQTKIATINGAVTIEGTSSTADFIINGQFTLASTGTHHAYPSRWSNFSHPMQVNGVLDVQGTLQFDEDYATTPFLPLITMDMDDPEIFIVNGTSTFNPSAVGGQRFGWEVREETIADGKTYLAHPTSFVPLAVIDDTGGALLLYFTITLDRSLLTFDSSCRGLISEHSPQFDQPSLSCVWVNSTVMRISSSRIPSSSEILQLNDLSTVKSPTFKIKPAENPVTPAAVIKPLPLISSCGTVTVDATLSTGIGSLPATYQWSVESASGDLSLLENFLNTAVSPTDSILDIPSSLFNHEYSYSFRVKIINWAGKESEISEGSLVTFATPTYRLPLVSIEGPPKRSHYAGKDLIVSAKIQNTECTPANKLIYAWSADGADEIVLGEAPSLLLPSTSQLLSLGSTLTLRLVVRIDGSSDMVNATVEITVLPPPFYVIRTGRSEFSIEQDAEIEISAEIRAPSSSSSPLSGVTCQWTLLNCPSLSVANASPVLQAGSLRLMTNLLLHCLRPNGTVYVFPVPSTPQPATKIADNRFSCSLKLSRDDLGATQPGTYEFALVTSANSINLTSVFSFNNMALNGSPFPPTVSIIVPDSDYYILPQQRINLQAQVNGDVGAEISPGLALSWQIAGASTELTELASTNSGPFLVIPYRLLPSSQPISVKLSAMDPSTRVIGTFTFELFPSIPPFGGSFFISPSGGIADTSIFNLSAPNWSALHPPIKYQYSIIANGLIESFISPILDDPLLSNVTIGSKATSYVSNITDAQNVTVRLTVTDATGASISIDNSVSLLPPQTTPTIEELRSLAYFEITRSFNLSDWISGSRLVSKFIRSLSKLTLTSEVSLIADHVTDQTIELSKVLPLTEVHSAVVLTQLKDIASIQSNSYAKILSAIERVLSSYQAKFGASSAYSWSSTTNFIDAIGSTFSRVPRDGSVSAATLLSTVSTHGDLLLASILPGEEELYYSNVGMALASRKINNQQAETVFISGPGNSVSFTATDFHSASGDGYLGYYVMSYNGTFPGLPEDAPFQIVSHVVLDDLANRRRDIVASGRVLTNFSTTTLDTEQSASCAKYDSNTGSWSSAECTTYKVSDGSSVVCDCGGSSAPLSLLFGLSSSSPTSPGSQKKGGMSGGAIAAIVVVLVVVALVALAILLALFVPQVAVFFRPFLRRNDTTNSVEVEMQRSTQIDSRATSSGGWAKASKPSV